MAEEETLVHPHDDQLTMDFAVGGVAPKPPDPQVGQEFGVPSNMPFTTFDSWSNGEMLAGSTALVPIDNLVEMRQKDGTARALMRLMTLPIMRALRESEWISPDEVDAEQEATFANAMFSLPPAMGGMSVSRTQFMRHALLAIFEGFSVFEEVRQVPTVGELEGKITLKKLAHRDSRTIRFRTDEKGGFNGVKQFVMVNGHAEPITIKKEKVWYYAVHEEENPFYGISFFEAAWHHWDIKRKLYYIAHLAAQFAAVPGRIGKIPKGQDPLEVQSFQKMLANFGFNTSGTMPIDYEVEFANQNTAFDFIKIIDHQNMQMAKSVLAPFLEQDQRQVLIDNGSDASADFFVMAVESIMSEIAEGMSHFLIPKYVDWNFGTGNYPDFKFGVLNDATRDVVKELFSLVATSQASMWDEEFIFELEKTLVDRLGLEVDFTKVEARKAKEAEEQAQLQSLYDQQQGGGPPQEGGGVPPSPGGGRVPPEQAAASGWGGGVSLARVIDKVEELVLAQRESDLDTSS
jgi:hypothetical protein